MRKSVILHITESYGSGVVSALKTYAKYTDDFEHHLLATETRYVSPDNTFQGNLSSLDLSLSKNIFKALRQIKARYDELEPDFIHLHSSLAGLYGRVLGLPSHKIIYTPHGYAFQRKDVNPFIKAGFAVVEYLLTKGSPDSVIAACGPGELQEAKRLTKNAVLLPNYADIPESLRWDDTRKDTVCMVGRISKQKDPIFFIETFKQIKAQRPELAIKFLWIGDGDAQLKAELIANDIEVTGWLDSEQTLKEIANSTIYFHTAAWDGLPMTLLEASKIGIPLVVRETEATEFLGDLTCATSDDAAKLLIKSFEDQAYDMRPNETINEMFTEARMSEVIHRLYAPPS